MQQQQTPTNATAAAALASSWVSSATSPIQWLLIECCPDVNRHPEVLTAGGTASETERNEVRALLSGLEAPLLRGGGGIANMLQPIGPHAGAVVEIRSIRRAVGEEVAGYAEPQIIGWGSLDDVDAILRRNARLLRDLAFPEGRVTVSCEYYFATRM